MKTNLFFSMTLLFGLALINSCCIIDPVPVPVTGVKLNKTVTSGWVGGSLSLVATVLPSDATIQDVTWKSSNSAIATVENGVVTLKSPGTCAITVTTVEGNKTATCALTVVPIVPVTGVTLDQTVALGVTGGSLTLTATVLPTDATNQDVTWDSDDPAIATVVDGVVTLISAGTCTITVTTDDGGETATCALTVEGVLINGILWATRNVDAPGTFAANPEDPGMLYQWNRNIGWSATDPLTSSPAGESWDSTNDTGTEWTAANDPCPDGWQVPTKAQLDALVTADLGWDATKKGRTFGSGANTIFLPAVGCRIYDGTLSDIGMAGFYGSSVQDDATTMKYFYFSESGITASSNVSKIYGISIRCVKK